ncbi:DNA repair protein RecO [Xylophilus sp. Leaf220]|uniref:DNA repair protein RecO n=1 Tax=Xylophilus sp. Leaf220 TaxID=1735686 RepID=UPI0006FB8FC2|nr:DNA repair protein RecO [Xylophilus sp. Leaf220]KQM68315.1 DNA repair protein RecO [Xylophilus sp. Leaf220]
MALKRVGDEPGFVLHQYAWSESSLILDVFSRSHGRVALVAKGAKKPTSNFRPVLLPLQPLRLTWTLSPGEGAEIHTLRGAEWAGGHVMPTGDALLSGYYLNELLIRLLARDDAHPALFDAYAAVVRVLASQHGEALQPVLRAFELRLLREVGFLPSLDRETATQRPLVPDERYVLVAEGGLRVAHDDDRVSLSGAQWQGLHRSLDADDAFTATLRAAADAAAELKPQLRHLLHYHCGVTTLRTRQMMMDLQAL